MHMLLDLSERLEAAPCLDAAWQVASSALDAIGVAWCHHAHVAALPEPDARPAAVLRFTTLPEAWRAHHAARRFWLVDAAVRHCARSLAPMPTGLHYARATGDAAWGRMCAEAEEAGFGDGLAVPLRGAPGTAYGGFSLVTRERGAAFEAWRAAHGRTAVLAAQITAQRLLVLAEAEPAPGLPRLSRRERECLTWLVAGLRSDRIAERLGLSRATIDLHLSRARRRLGAATREQAVAKALALGLLRP